MFQPMESDDNLKFDFTSKFLQEMSELYMSTDYSDVVFIIAGKKLPAHKIILAKRSSYFRSLLVGHFQESTVNEIQLNVSLEAFEVLLYYLYTGHMSFVDMDHDSVLDLFKLCHEYQIDDLIAATLKFWSLNLTLDSCCALLDAASLFDLEPLKNAAVTLMDRNADELLKSNDFKALSQSSLSFLLKRDTFFAPEIQIFIAVADWCKKNPNTDSEAVISLIRLPLIEIDDLVTIVGESKIISSDRILGAIRAQRIEKNLPYRIHLPIVNVATIKEGAKVIEGRYHLPDTQDVMLNGIVNNHTGFNGYIYHIIGKGSIVIQLPRTYYLGSLRLLLWDLEGSRTYSFYIETSVNKEDWKMAVDKRNERLQSWQEFTFEPRPVVFLRIVGTYNSANDQFHVVHFETPTSSTPI